MLLFPLPSFHQLLHIHHYPSSETGTVGQRVAHVDWYG
jgi:hypothetical protein